MTGDVPKRQYYARRCKSTVAPEYPIKPNFEAHFAKRRRRGALSNGDVFLGAIKDSLPKISFNDIVDRVSNWPQDIKVSLLRILQNGGIFMDMINKFPQDIKVRILQILQYDEIDRISNLPQHIKVNILQRLSVHEAATTSVLSKDWRFIWTMRTHLVLDYLFFTKLTSGKDILAAQSAYSRAINMIISGHVGPLYSFNLYVPPNLNKCHASRFIDHFLNKDTTGLELTNSELNGDLVPARVFDCAELVELKLNSWMLKPTLKFGGFAKLTRVELVNISISANLSFGHQLKHFYLHLCTGVQHLGSQFTNGNNLTDLLFFASEQIDWQWLECTKKLDAFGLGLTSTSPNLKKFFNLIKFLCNTPSITKLWLNGYTVEVLGPVPSMLKVLTPKIENVKILTLINVGFGDLCQLSNCVCLIRCLPNLESLWISLEPEVKSLDPTILTDEQCMESLDSKGMVLDRLHTVAIKGVVAEMISVVHLIKVLFASSPWLRVMSIKFNASVDNENNIKKGKFFQELVQCPKKSSVFKFHFP